MAITGAGLGGAFLQGFLQTYQGARQQQIEKQLRERVINMQHQQQQDLKEYRASQLEAGQQQQKDASEYRTARLELDKTQEARLGKQQEWEMTAKGKSMLTTSQRFSEENKIINTRETRVADMSKYTKMNDILQDKLKNLSWRGNSESAYKAAKEKAVERGILKPSDNFKEVYDALGKKLTANRERLNLSAERLGINKEDIPKNRRKIKDAPGVPAKVARPKIGVDHFVSQNEALFKNVKTKAQMVAALIKLGYTKEEATLFVDGN